MSRNSLIVSNNNQGVAPRRNSSSIKKVSNPPNKTNKNKLPNIMSISSMGITQSVNRTDINSNLNLINRGNRMNEN
jgi:hypothetical protein